MSVQERIPLERRRKCTAWTSVKPLPYPGWRWSVRTSLWADYGEERYEKDARAAAENAWLAWLRGEVD